jgi:hypothetical protein
VFAGFIPDQLRVVTALFGGCGNDRVLIITFPGPATVVGIGEPLAIAAVIRVHQDDGLFLAGLQARGVEQVDVAAA